MDKKYQKILLALDRNARRSDAVIAKEVGLSRDAVSYRIKKLQEQGIIKKFVTVLNTPQLGLMNFRVHLKFSGLTKKLESEVKQYLADHTFWTVRVRGYWDFNTGFLTKDYRDFKKFWDAFRFRFGDQLDEFTVDTMVTIHHYTRSFLLPGTDPRKEAYSVWGAYKAQTQLDELDEKILRIIENDARRSNIHIAQQCNTSERTVRYRIKRLVELGVIQRFRPSLDLAKMGFIYAKLSLRLQKLSPHVLRQLQEYALNDPNIVYLGENTSGPDVEIEYQVPSMKDMYDKLDMIRDTFSENIKSWMINEYIEEAQISYLRAL